MKELVATRTDIAHLEKGQQEVRDDLETLSNASDKDSKLLLTAEDGSKNRKHLALK